MISPALKFEVGIYIQPTFSFSTSTVWPSVNSLAVDVDAIDRAADALVELLALKGKKP